MWRGTEVHALGKNMGKKEPLWQRGFGMKRRGKSVGQWLLRTQFIKIFGHCPFHRDQASYHNTQSVWHSSHSSQMTTISFISKRNCLAPDGEYVLSLCVLSAEREDKHKDIHRRIACRGSFLASWAGDWPLWLSGYLTRSIMQPVCILWPQVRVVKW